MLGKPPQLFGISATSMATVRSNTRFAMRRLGRLEPRAPLDADWRSLRDGLPSRAATTLTRFIEFHSREGIPPSTVSDASFERCQAWIRAATLCRSPSRLFAQMRYQWNKAAREQPNLGLPILGAARQRVRCTVPLETMHPDLQADLERMRRHLGCSDLDDLDADHLRGDHDDGLAGRASPSPAPRRALRAITIEERMRHARQAVWALVQTGVPLEEIRGIRDLVVPVERARQVIRFMAGRGRALLAGTVAHLKKYPGDFEVIRVLLGHKTDRTARKSYTGPEKDSAFERFDQTVLEQMRTLRPRKSGPDRRTDRRRAMGGRA
ncbi:MAG: hypothetical protein KJS79_15755 [Rhodospirillales bacterium]|nr:hypothetical protein [Rhodospirillales bacterium]UNC16046.1 hypothetical protein FE249_11600 [Acidiphilium multivorum]